MGPEGLQPEAWVCVSHAEPSMSLAELGQNGAPDKQAPCLWGRGGARTPARGLRAGKGLQRCWLLQGNPVGGGPAAELGTMAGAGEDGKEEVAGRAPGASGEVSPRGQGQPQRTRLGGIWVFSKLN